MTVALTPIEKLRRSQEASNINVKKAFIFAAGWWLKKKHGFKKYPDAYKAAKDNIGMKSLVFNVPRWPKKYPDGPLGKQMQIFYQLMEHSLSNQDWRIDNLVGQLCLTDLNYYHKHISREICHELWWDSVTDVSLMTKQPLSTDSRALARQVFESEDFEQPMWVLCDSLIDTGHDFEASHLRTGKHTPACPILRKIAGIK